MTEGDPPSADGSPCRAPSGLPADGLGTSSAGAPTFAAEGLRSPWSPPTAVPPPPPPPGPEAAAPLLLRPQHSRLPALLTAAVVLLVLGVVALGTAVARYADTHRVAPAATPRPAVLRPGQTSTAGPHSIEFSTQRGTGRLVVLERSWGRPALPGRTASHLRIRLELVCTSGSVAYAPEYFSLFDGEGRLVETSLAAPEADPLSFGRLGPGERVRGSVAFDLPRHEVTLVMGDDVSSVTALRIAD